MFLGIRLCLGTSKQSCKNVILLKTLLNLYDKNRNLSTLKLTATDETFVLDEHNIYIANFAANSEEN